jgi:hypothetical protein
MIFSFYGNEYHPANRSGFHGLPFVLYRATRGEEPALVSVTAATNLLNS